MVEDHLFSSSHPILLQPLYAHDYFLVWFEDGFDHLVAGFGHPPR